MKSLFLSDRLYWIMGGLIVLFFFSFGYQVLFPVAQVLLILFFAIVFIDIFILFRNKKGLEASRFLTAQMGLGV